MRAHDRYSDRGVDVIAGSGDDAPKLARRLPERWRRRVALAVTLVVGLVVGGYAGYRWPDPQAEIDRRTVALTARMGELDGLNVPYPPYRLRLVLRNTGPLPVTLERTRLDLAGYDTFSSGGYPRQLRPGEPAVFHYGVYPTCDRARPGSRPPKVRLRVSPASGEVRTVRLRPAKTGRGLRSGYAIVCSLPPATLGVHAQTLDTSVQQDGSLRFRLRLQADPTDPGGLPEGLRLLEVGARLAGLEVGSQLPGAGTWAMPSTVRLRLSVEHCGRARQSLHEPVQLRVALVSEEGPRLVYVPVDFDLGRALRSYVAERCGSGS